MLSGEGGSKDFLPINRTRFEERPEELSMQAITDPSRVRRRLKYNKTKCRVVEIGFAVFFLFQRLPLHVFCPPPLSAHISPMSELGLNQFQKPTYLDKLDFSQSRFGSENGNILNIFPP